ncbi:MAG TPA: TetR/AcrR family transcriptional regulator [bacterium]|nr:TetR/AcrR family transcriptional regulator [bacterium]
MKPEERKNAISEAAAACFADRGYHATQVSDIIAKAGVARGTFYLYFKSKHDIFDTILDEFISTLQDQIRIVDLSSETSPAKQVRGNVQRVIDLMFSRPEIGRILFNEAVGLDPEIDDRLKDFYGSILGMIERSISKGMGLGIVRRVDPRVAACIILGGFREILVQVAIFKTSSVDRKIIVDSLIDVLLGGLSEKPFLAN